MRHASAGVQVLALGLLFNSARSFSQSAATPIQQHASTQPSKADCLTKSARATDSQWLSQRSAPQINQLDWELSACVGQFAPLNPRYSALIVDAHGRVADEMRSRIEKAIGTLPPQAQAHVWAAFNSDRGSH